MDNFLKNFFDLILGAVTVILGLLFFIYVILPICGIILSIILAISILFSLYISSRCFFSSLFKHINPYKTYFDSSSSGLSCYRKSYFFGPGYHQIAITSLDAFSFLKDYIDSFRDWKNRHTDDTWYCIFVIIFYFFAIIFSYVFGSIFIASFSILLFSIILPFMCFFYLLFSTVWIFDRFLLLINSIHSRCPKCKHISVVPNFICPSCGVVHKKLTPGPYGVLKRKCLCGKLLATTYFNGRSKYKSACPHCTSELVSSDSTQFGIQLVGGVNTGKTTFLAAFYHRYINRLNLVSGISIEPSPVSAFKELENIFHNGTSSATTDTNANMYSLLHKIYNNTPIQVTIYDIAGEAFNDFSKDIRQLQFRYCEAIIFIIDPTSTPRQASDTMSSFITEFESLKGHRSQQLSQIPIAVTISKGDLFMPEIGLNKIRTEFKSRSYEYADKDGNATIDLVRNGVCRNFLRDHGFSNVINLVESKFTNVNFFPFSAIGHDPLPGQKFDPWGVIDPVYWIFKHKISLFENIISKF
jgi:GTPase SAR1 family protein